MGHFTTLFALVLKRFFCTKKAIILFIILLLTIFLANSSFNEYKETISNVQHFQNINASTFSNIIKNYTHYSLLGIKCYFVPSPLGKLLKTSGRTEELSARVDSLVSLDIFINAKGSALFEEDSTSPFRLSFIILVLGTLSVLFLGYESMRDKEFIKSLASLLSYKKIFIYIVLSKIILLTLILMGFFAILLILIKFNGFTLSNEVLTGLAGYFSAAWIMIIGFFSIGVLVGNIKKKVSALTLLLSIWFILVFFLPGCLDSYLSRKSKNITSNYKVEFDKYEILINFEKKCYDEVGKFSEEKRGKFKEFAEYYWNDVYQKIEALEEKVKNDIYTIAKMNKKLTILYPVTFFKLTGDECSSMGLENLLKFYGFLQELKRRFLRFWIDRVYYNDVKELVSFIKKDENLYYAESQLPENFWIGMLINMVYIIILLFASYFRFKKAMLPIPKETIVTDNVNIQLEKGKIITVHGEHPDFFKLFINAFFGKTKSFKGKIKIDGKDIGTMGKKSFLYLPHPNNIPEDIKTRDLLWSFKKLLKITKEEFSELKINVGKGNLKKRFADLKITDKANILLLIVEMNKCKTYVFYNFAFELPKNFRIDLPERMAKLIHEDTMVIDLVSKGDLWIDSDKYFNINMKNKTYYVATVVKEKV